MSENLPVNVFVINIVVNNRSEFLLIQEAKSSVRGKWFFPAGPKKSKETLIEAAVRETEEEAGIITEPRAFLYIIHQIDETEALQIILISEPIKGKLKIEEDNNSIQAKWFSKETIKTLNLRTPAVLDIIDKYEKRSFISIDDFYQF
ncbi:MAG: Phosphatase NudJ [Candidatus Heimdallarchaeota archaeon LC_3]|nr:MAG: Phosphatase NudJ [Candidatus Heimdallarchaeota archaeon LC_3]